MKKYRMERAGQLDVKNVTRNALKKNNSALVEGVLPFDMEKLQPFDMGYLSGFQAEKRDMEKESLTPEVESEVKQYTVEQLKADVMGQYSAVRWTRATQISGTRDGTTPCFRCGS